MTDHCEAVRSVIELGRLGETYNIGSAGEISNLALVRKLCHLLDEKLPRAQQHAQLITHVRDRAGHDRRYAIDSTKIRCELGWSPRHELGAGLAVTVDWYLTNQQWLNAIALERQLERWLVQQCDQRSAP